MGLVAGKRPTSGPTGGRFHDLWRTGRRVEMWMDDGMVRWWMMHGHDGARLATIQRGGLRERRGTEWERVWEQRVEMGCTSHAHAPGLALADSFSPVAALAHDQPRAPTYSTPMRATDSADWLCRTDVPEGVAALELRLEQQPTIRLHPPMSPIPCHIYAIALPPVHSLPSACRHNHTFPQPNTHTRTHSHH